jgi:hypothetical protein
VNGTLSYTKTFYASGALKTETFASSGNSYGYYEDTGYRMTTYFASSQNLYEHRNENFYGDGKGRYSKKTKSDGSYEIYTSYWGDETPTDSSDDTDKRHWVHYFDANGNLVGASEYGVTGKVVAKYVYSSAFQFGNSGAYSTSGFDEIRSVFRMVDGTSIVSGYTWRSGLPTEPFIGRFDAAGSPMWSKTIFESWQNGHGDLRTMSDVGDGFVIGGSFTLNTSASGLYLAKYNYDGNQIWSKLNAGMYPSQIVYANQNIYVAGSKDYRAVIGKYANDGALIWTKEIAASGLNNSDAEIWGRGVDVDSQGNLIVVAMTSGSIDGLTPTGSRDAYLAKYDASGNRIWHRFYGLGGEDNPSQVKCLEDGSVILVGHTYGSIKDGVINKGASDAFVSKFDADGNLMWATQFGTDSYDEINSIMTDESGNVYLAGYTNGSFDGQTPIGQTRGDSFFAAISSDGWLFALKQLGSNEGLNGTEEAFGIDLDPNGNVVIVGRSSHAIGPWSTNYVDDGFILNFKITPPIVSITNTTSQQLLKAQDYKPSLVVQKLGDAVVDDTQPSGAEIFGADGYWEMVGEKELQSNTSIGQKVSEPSFQGFNN